MHILCRLIPLQQHEYFLPFLIFGEIRNQYGMSREPALNQYIARLYGSEISHRPQLLFQGSGSAKPEDQVQVTGK